MDKYKVMIYVRYNGCHNGKQPGPPRNGVHFNGSEVDKNVRADPGAEPQIINNASGTSSEALTSCTLPQSTCKLEEFLLGSFPKNGKSFTELINPDGAHR